MKNKKLKVLLASIFALSLGLSISSVSHKANNVQSVSAYSFDDEDPEAPVSSDDEDPEAPVSSDDDNLEAPVSSEEPQGGGEVAIPEETATPESEEGAPKETSSEEDKPSEKSTTSKFPSLREILSALKNTFRDAWNDLKSHFKKWLKR